MKRFHDLTAVELADRLLERGADRSLVAHESVARALSETCILMRDFESAQKFIYVRQYIERVQGREWKRPRVETARLRQAYGVAICAEHKSERQHD